MALAISQVRPAHPLRRAGAFPQKPHGAGFISTVSWTIGAAIRDLVALAREHGYGRAALIKLIEQMA